MTGLHAPRAEVSPAVAPRGGAREPEPSGDGTSPRLEVLLLCDMPPRIAGTVFDHLRALHEGSRHHVRLLPVRGDLPAALDLDRFDVIVLHYTLVISDDRYLSAAARARLAAASPVKAVFIQDEYRFVDRTVAALREIGAGLLFTCVPPEEVEKVYPAEALPDMAKVSILTGYVSAALLARRVPPIAGRPVDVGYRARGLPAWLGDLGQEKTRIGTRFLADAARFGLVCDISYREEDRIYGENWIRFLTRCKAVLGVESGSSVFDFSGEIAAAVERDLAREPHLGYGELRARHLAGHHGRIRLNQISPRCFEAASLRTLMILYEGDYSGRLAPWRHYVPLRKDHGNMEEVVAVLRDAARMQDIVDRAYAEVARAPQNSYAAMTGLFDDAIAESWVRGAVPLRAPYSDDEFAVAGRPGLSTRWRWLRRNVFMLCHVLFYRGLLAGLSNRGRDRVQAWIHRNIRPIYRSLLK